MGLFSNRGRPSEQFERQEHNSMIPRWSRPPERNTTDWLKMYSKSPRLAVVERIASDLSFAAGKLYSLDSGSKEREVTDHPFLDFWNTPNPMYEYSSAALWRLIEIYLLLKGEGYFVIERDSTGQPAEIWPLPVHWVMMTPYLGYPYYKVRTTNGTILDISVDDMFVMKELNPLDPFMRGLGQSESIADEVEIDEYAAKFQKSFFYNDATPGLLVSIPKSTEGQRQRFLDEWMGKFQGVFQKHKVATTGGEITVQQVGDSMRDMEMIEGRTYIRNAALEHFGVPREIMGITESSNRATSEAAQFIYAQNVLMPKLRRREEAINKQLLPLFGDDLVWRFDEIVPRNQEFDKARAVEGWNSGLMIQNEARELLDMPPLGKRGDVFKTTYADVFVRKADDPAEVSLAMQNLQYVTDPMPTDGHSVEAGQPADSADDSKQFSVGVKSVKGGLSLAATNSLDQARKEHAARFELATAKYFREQSKRIADALGGTQKADSTVWQALNKYISAQGEDMVDVAAWAALPEEERKAVVDQFVSSLINWPGEADILQKIYTPLWRDAYAKGAQVAQEVYKVPHINRPELISTAKLLGAQRIRGIERTTKRAIADIIAGGIENGDIRADMTRAIQEEMGVSSGRARVIADNETATSLEAGQYDMMRKAGATSKTWHHRPQKNPREDHIAMEGERVPIDGKFSNGLRHPKDPECNNAGQVIGCRCYITYGFDGGMDE